MNLSLAHVADLRRSGLCDETIDLCGFWSESDPSEVARLLRWDRPPASPWPCLAIPYFEPDGSPAGFVRLRPDHPRPDDRGKPIKYESPRGVPLLPYFPPWVSHNLARRPGLLVVTEGEKKAAAVDQCGYPCVGVAGTYGWQVPRTVRGTSERRVIDSLARLARSAGTVVLAYDHDAEYKDAVKTARGYLAAALDALGVRVLCVRLAEASETTKVGIDDVIARGGENELRHLLRWAEPATIPQWARDPQPELPGCRSSGED